VSCFNSLLLYNSLFIKALSKVLPYFHLAKHAVINNTGRVQTQTPLSLSDNFNLMAMKRLLVSHWNALFLKIFNKFFVTKPAKSMCAIEQKWCKWRSTSISIRVLLQRKEQCFVYLLLAESCHCHCKLSIVLIFGFLCSPFPITNYSSCHGHSFTVTPVSLWVDNHCVFKFLISFPGVLFVICTLFVCAWIINYIYIPASTKRDGTILVFIFVYAVRDQFVKELRCICI